VVIFKKFYRAKRRNELLSSLLWQNKVQVDTEVTGRNWIIILKDNKDSEREGERSYTKPNMIWKFLNDAIRVANSCFQEGCSSQSPEHMIQYDIIQQTHIFTSSCWHFGEILANDHLDTQLLYFIIPLLWSSTCFEHYMFIRGRLNCIDAAFGIITLSKWQSGAQV